MSANPCPSNTAHEDSLRMLPQLERQRAEACRSQDHETRRMLQRTIRILLKSVGVDLKKAGLAAP